MMISDQKSIFTTVLDVSDVKNGQTFRDWWQTSPRYALFPPALADDVFLPAFPS